MSVNINIENPSTPTCGPETCVDTIRIYNTLSRAKQPLDPIVPGRVGIYLCGPTVYDKAHIGHMVGPVIFDTIKRYLTYCGYDVTLVVNITDVDDKLIQASLRRGIPMDDVATEMTADYLANLAGMGVDQIDHMPKATESMDAIVALIGTLVDQGFAYAVEGDVFFDVARDADYGKLTNRSLDSLQGGGGGAAAKKRSPADFALWKAAKPDEPSWDSPWGQGRPGWHIECSAMSRVLLGESFDIHGGGLDLIFPHHENEIAQSECCHGKPMARIWMHNGLLRAAADAGKVGGRSDREKARGKDCEKETSEGSKKMSRSEGAGGLAELITRQGGERIRFFLLRTHYRSTVLFSEPAIEEAAAGLESFYRFFKRYERITGDSFYASAPVTCRREGAFEPGDDTTLGNVAAARTSFLQAMDDDFNTGSAIGDLFELVRTLNKAIDDGDLETSSTRDEAQLNGLRQGARTLRELSATLGLFLAAPASSDEGNSQQVAGVMDLILDLRAAARANKDFATADKIRDVMVPLKITLEDRAGGTDWSSDETAATSLDGLMDLVLQLRAAAREAKDFATADKIRDALGPVGLVIEDRADGTDWSSNL